MVALGRKRRNGQDILAESVRDRSPMGGWFMVLVAASALTAATLAGCIGFGRLLTRRALAARQAGFLATFTAEPPHDVAARVVVLLADKSTMRSAFFRPPVGWIDDETWQPLGPVFGWRPLPTSREAPTERGIDLPPWLKS